MSSFIYRSSKTRKLFNQPARQPKKGAVKPETTSTNKVPFFKRFVNKLKQMSFLELTLPVWVALTVYVVNLIFKTI